MRLMFRLGGVAAAAVSAILLPAAAPAAPARPAAAAVPVCGMPGTSLETWFAPEGDGFAGGIVYVVEFSNIGKATCAVKGFPVVKLTANGQQVGLKATTSGPAPATVTLKPGRTAHVVLAIHDAGAFCNPVPTDGLRVRPPGIPVAQTANFALESDACPGKSTMDVGAIYPGVGIPHYTIR